MGVFRNFPYSNFHEMNMDEIIKIIKNMLEEWATYHAEWDQWMSDLEASWTEYQDDVNAQWEAYQNTMNTAWQSMQNFINNYFDNLDVQEEINNKIVSMIQTGEFGLLVNEYIPPAVNAWLNLHITEPEGVVIDTSLTVSGACADAKATGDAINEVKSEINGLENSIGIIYNTLTPYLYKKNTYIDNNGIDTELSGYDTYKIPLDDFDIFHFSWDTSFYTGLSTTYVLTLELSDSSRIKPSGGASYGTWFLNNIQEGMFFGKIPSISDIIAIYITVKRDLINNIQIAINKPCVQIEVTNESQQIINEDNCILSQYYYSDQLTNLPAPYYMNWIKLKQGDIIKINKTVADVTGKGRVIRSDGSISTFYDATFTATSDCVICIYNNTSATGDIIFVPASPNLIIDNGKILKFIAGVIRNSGNGWEYIEDSGHEPLNLTSVSVDPNGKIEIDYGFTASKVLSLVATPDEKFARSYTIGGSVGLDKTLFDVYSLPKTFGGLVTITNDVVDVSNSSFTSGSLDTTTGEIKLYHPTLSALLATEKFNISASAKNYNVSLGSQGNDYVSLFLKDNSGTIIKTFTSASIYVTRFVNSAFINANNIVSADGNFWIYGVMEIYN